MWRSTRSLPSISPSSCERPGSDLALLFPLQCSQLDDRGDDVSETWPFSALRACVARLVRAELFGENPGIEERPEMHNDDAFALGILVPVQSRWTRLLPLIDAGRTSGSAPLSFCPGRSGIAAILISPPELPIVRSRTAGNWDMPTPFPTPFGSLAWPRSSPEMPPRPAPAATIAGRLRMNTDSPTGRPMAGSSKAGRRPKG